MTPAEYSWAIESDLLKLALLRGDRALRRFRRYETVELPPFGQALCDQELPAKGQE